MSESPANPPSPGRVAFRLDPSPSRVFSWLEFDPSAPEIRDEATGRVIQPAGPALTVRYRSTGAIWSHWPVSEEEARRVMNPGSEFDHSIGRAFGSLVKAHKSSRQVHPGERTARPADQQPRQSKRGWFV